MEFHEIFEIFDSFLFLIIFIFVSFYFDSFYFNQMHFNNLVDDMKSIYRSIYQAFELFVVIHCMSCFEIPDIIPDNLVSPESILTILEEVRI